MQFCNCNYILFTKLPWLGDSEETFWSSSQAATCPPVYHTRWRLYTVSLIAERQAGKLWIPTFTVFGLTRLGIEPKSTVSVADALSTRPLIGKCSFWCSFWLMRFMNEIGKTSLCAKFEAPITCLKTWSHFYKKKVVVSSCLHNLLSKFKRLGKRYFCPVFHILFK